MAVNDPELQQADPAAPTLAEPPEHDWSDSSPDEGPVLSHSGRRRLLWVAAIIVLLLLLLTLPPLLNVSRYQRRIAQAISQSIGRPVHFDSVTVHVLPWPGFTIQNFVVTEDPAFGAEPAMRANAVEARLRVRSLWRRRVEFARIRLQAPSVNLVRRSDGVWNLQSIVTQAGSVQNAPTSQSHPGTAPRFPYIEATGARINLKLDQAKLPYSLVDSDFALWLPDEHEWQIRLAGRPLRTDTDVSDVGQLSVEGTLGRGAPSAALAPLELRIGWKSTPMGEAAKLFAGQDAGWRGQASAEAAIHGTPANMRLSTDLHVHNLRRDKFVPAEELQLDAHCVAEAMGVLHQVHNLRCTLPTHPGASLLQAMGIGVTPAGLAQVDRDLTFIAELPDAADLQSASMRLEMNDAPPGWALRWMRLFSQRIPASLQLGGSLDLLLQRDPKISGGNWTGSVACRCLLPTLTPPGNAPADAYPVGGQTPASTAPLNTSWLLRATHDPGSEPANSSSTVTLSATRKAPALPGIPEPLVDRSDPAMTVTGHLDRSGYGVQYGSAALASYAGHLLPTLQDGLDPALTGPVQSTRKWGGDQTWTAANAARPTRLTHRRRR